MQQSKHKPNCKWDGYYRSLIFRNSQGPDEVLRISEDRLEYEHNEWTNDPDKDEEIEFNFCPVCGVRLRDEEEAS